MKILLVDDNELTLEIERLTLESCGLEADTATNGDTGVELAEKNKYSAIFTDIQMPKTDGFAVAEKIRRFDDTVPIIALSAEKIESTDERLIKSKITDTLTKPLDIQGVKKVLDKFVNINIEKAAEKAFSGYTSDYFNYDELFSVFEDEETINLLIQDFLSTHGKDCSMIEKYIEERDFLSARGVIHTLLGVTSMMQCIPLYEACAFLGSELRKEKIDSLSSFKNIWAKTIDEFKAISHNSGVGLGK